MVFVKNGPVQALFKTNILVQVGRLKNIPVHGFGRLYNAKVVKKSSHMST